MVAVVGAVIDVVASAATVVGEDTGRCSNSRILYVIVTSGQSIVGTVVAAGGRNRSCM